MPRWAPRRSLRGEVPERPPPGPHGAPGRPPADPGLEDTQSWVDATALDPVTPVHSNPTLDPEAFPRLGRYVLRGELGRGGIGVVFRAWDPELGREVALKVL